MDRKAAEALALGAFAWLAGREEEMGAFLAATGASAADVRQSLRRPDFLGFVLDFLLSDERMVIGCAAHLGVAPDRLMAARAALPGGDAPHWL